MRKLLTILGSLLIGTSGVAYAVSYTRKDIAMTSTNKDKNESIEVKEFNNESNIKEELSTNTKNWNDIFRDSISGFDINLYKKQDKPSVITRTEKIINRNYESDFINDLKDLTPNTDNENAKWEEDKVKTEIDKQIDKEELEDLVKFVEGDVVKIISELVPNTNKENAESISRKVEKVKKELETKFINDLKDLTPNTDNENAKWEEDKIKAEVDKQIDKEELEDLVKFVEGDVVKIISELVPNTNKENAEWAEPSHVKAEIDKQFDKEEDEEFIKELNRFTEALTNELNEWAELSHIKAEVDKLLEIEDLIDGFNDLAPYTNKEVKEWISRKNEKVKKELETKFINDLKYLTPNTDNENAEWAEPSHIKAEIDKLLEIEDLIDGFNDLVSNTIKGEPDLDEWIKQNTRQDKEIKELLDKEKDKTVLKENLSKIIHRTKESKKYLSEKGVWVSDLLTAKLKRVLSQLNK
ncbi:hypothetical protein [Mycoplasma feriruminatoris]|uniref:Uncharacterized protein n=1 Tax=Mycoplasma feriruminatoris TaxID=1179777 RepID=A0AAX3TGH0_9MOLU|nr:hypothetical protein [Mycoplasma feriruminatoris]WFQ93003.1 hypothetical protein MFERI14822_00796 [Mycoplasma feriruminatoris]